MTVRTAHCKWTFRGKLSFIFLMKTITSFPDQNLILLYLEPHLGLQSYTSACNHMTVAVQNGDSKATSLEENRLEKATRYIISIHCSLSPIKFWEDILYSTLWCYSFLLHLLCSCIIQGRKDEEELAISNWIANT